MRVRWLGGLLGTLLLGACAGSGPSALPAAFLEPSASGAPSASPSSAAASSITQPVAPSVGPMAPSPTPATRTNVEPEPPPTPSPTPKPKPDTGSTPEPDVDLRVAWQDWRIPASEDHIDIILEVVTTGVTRSRCSLTHLFQPDHPGVDPSTDTLEPTSSQVVALYDGRHEFSLACPTRAGTLRDQWEIFARDNLPERCLGFDFVGRPLSSSTLESLESGMIGSWEGCVTTPWVPAYWVDFTFRSDGTYSAVSGEQLDGQVMNAMYWGTEADSQGKRWALNDIEDSGKGLGQIDIAWAEHSDTNRDELRNIELMGDQLRFELIHMGEYGPVTFELHRTGTE